MLPALPIPNFVLFPGCTVRLQFGFPALQEQLELAHETGGRLVVSHALQGAHGWAPAKVGCLAEVRDIRTNSQGLQAQLAGVQRVAIVSQRKEKGRLYWGCRPLEIQQWNRKKAPELQGMPELVKNARAQLPPALWLDVAAFHFPGLPFEQKLALLAEPDPHKRYYQLLESARKVRKKRKISLN